MVENDMDKRKVKVARSYKEHVEKVLRAFQANDDGVIFELESKYPVSDEELASEIKRRSQALSTLMKEAEKRGLLITAQVGQIGIPIDLSELDIRIFKHKEL